MADAKLVISIEDDGAQPPPSTPQQTPPAGRETARDASIQAPMTRPVEGRVEPPSRQRVDADSSGGAPDSRAETVTALDVPGIQEFDDSIGNAGIAGKVEAVGEKFGEFNGALERATSGLLGLPAKIILTQVMRQIANSAIDMFKMKKEEGPQDVRVVNFDELTGRAESPSGAGAAEAPEGEPEGEGESGGLRDRLESLKNKGKEKLEQGKEKLNALKEKGGELIDKGKEGLGKLKEQGMDFLGRAKGRVSGAGTRAGAAARPVASKAGAAVSGAGAKVGATVGRVATPLASSAGAMVGAGSVKAAAGAGKLAMAGAGAAMPAVGGAISAATAGVASLAAAAGPAAIAMVAVAGAAVAAKLAWDLFSRTLGKEVERLRDVSGDVATADAMTELRREMATIRRGEEIGPGVAKFENLRSRFEDTSFKLGTEIKGLLVEIFEAVRPLFELVSRVFESGVEIVGAMNDLTGITRDLAQFKFSSALERIGKIEAHTKAAAMALMRDSDDFDSQDPFFWSLVNQAQGLGVNLNQGGAGPAPAAAPVMPGNPPAPAAGPNAPPAAQMQPNAANLFGPGAAAHTAGRMVPLPAGGAGAAAAPPAGGGGELIQHPDFWKGGP